MFGGVWFCRQLWTVSCRFVLTVGLVVGLDGFFFFGQLVVVDGFVVARDVVANVAGRLVVVLSVCLVFDSIGLYILRSIFGGLAG